MQFFPPIIPNVSWVCLIISWVNIRNWIYLTRYCDRVEYRFLLRRCTSKSCYLGCHGNSIRRYFKFYLKTNISHGICVWWEQMVWSLQMQQFPPQEKVNGGATSKTVWRADGRWQHLQHWENPPLSEEKKGADVQLGADTSAYISWFWTISPQRSSIYTHTTSPSYIFSFRLDCGYTERCRRYILYSLYSLSLSEFLDCEEEGKWRQGG